MGIVSYGNRREYPDRLLSFSGSRNCVADNDHTRFEGLSAIGGRFTCLVRVAATLPARLLQELRSFDCAAVFPCSTQQKIGFHAVKEPWH